jgi:hypothetical protein
VDGKLEQELQAERIEGRKDWVRYVELKTAIHREHVARVEADLAPIVDDLSKHDRAPQPVSNAS